MRVWRPSSGRVAVGVLLLLGGAGWLLDVAGLIDFRLRDLLSLSLIVLGLALIAGARRGLNPAIVVLGTAIIALLFVSRPLREFQAESVISIGAPSNDSLQSGGIGERIERPLSVADLRDEYEQRLGSLTLDLSEVDFPEDTTTVAARVDIGQLVVIVPEDVSFTVETSAAAGEVRVVGRRLREGVNIRRTFTSEAGLRDRRLSLRLSVQFGSIEVRRG